MDNDKNEDLGNTHIVEGLKSDFGLDVSALSRITGGYVNEVYSGRSGDEDVVVRIARERNAYPVEMWVYNRFQELGIPCPKTIAYQETPSQIGSPTMIMEKVSGKSLDQVELSPEIEERIYKEVGEILKKVHQIKIDGFGFLTIQGDQLTGRNKTAKESWGERTLKDLEYLSEHNLVTKLEYKAILSIYNEILKAEVNQSVFIYNDLHKAHIFTDGEKITGVIDLGNSFAGDPRYDIASTLFFLEDSEAEFFKEGYGDLSEDPMVSKYLIMIAALKSGWRHKAGNFSGSEKALVKLRQALTTQSYE